jgi:hypothetical protein
MANEIVTAETLRLAGRRVWSNTRHESPVNYWGGNSLSPRTYPRILIGTSNIEHRTLNAKYRNVCLAFSIQRFRIAGTSCPRPV